MNSEDWLEESLAKLDSLAETVQKLSLLSNLLNIFQSKLPLSATLQVHRYADGTFQAQLTNPVNKITYNSSITKSLVVALGDIGRNL